MFVTYLQQKFGTTEELNRRFGLAFWSNSIADWKDFPDMRGCVNAGLSSEFAAFQRKIAADYLTWQAEIVNEYRRENQFLTHNLDFEWKKFGAEIAFGGDSIRSLKQKNYLVMECQAQAFKYWTPYPG